ncbi:MAG: STAS-like domain-containing protein [Thermoplasmata archaeon]
MTMSRNIISIKNKFSDYLALRDTADALFNSIEAMKSDEVILDFKGITGVTHSFADQYYVNLKKTMKIVRTINMEENVSKMMNIVKERFKPTTFKESMEKLTSKIV